MSVLERFTHGMLSAWRCWAVWMLSEMQHEPGKAWCTSVYSVAVELLTV